jgi:hypothetical protein
LPFLHVVKTKPNSPPRLLHLPRPRSSSLLQLNPPQSKPPPLQPKLRPKPLSLPKNRQPMQ